MDMTKVKLLSSVAEVETSVVAISKAAGKLQESIHKTAVSVLKLWYDKKIEAGEAARLLSAIQGASPYHQNAFSKWVGMCTNLQWSGETKVWFAHPSDDNTLTGKFFKQGRDNPFWKLSPPKAAQPFDMIAELERIIAKAAKHVQKPVDGDKVDREMVRQLQSIIAAKAE
jgi:hypothetical protein